jgi:hypothetical protein
MRVLLGTDGSPDAVRAADWLARFPLPAGSQILVVSVLPHLGSRAPEHANAMHAQARQVVEDARLKLAPGAVDVRVMEGSVRERLLQIAEEWKADLESGRILEDLRAVQLSFATAGPEALQGEAGAARARQACSILGPNISVDAVLFMLFGGIGR